jgi:hypothetical protein
MLADFYPASYREDGVDYYCKRCRLKTTNVYRVKRAYSGPDCKNCGSSRVYYAKGLCHTCYNYKLRTGKNRPTEADYTKEVVDWVFRIIDGETVEDIAETSSLNQDTIRRVLLDRYSGEKFSKALSVIPREIKVNVKSKITGRLRPKDVRRIKELYHDYGMGQKEIGELYGRTYSSISRIVNGSRYSDVE